MHTLLSTNQKLTISPPNWEAALYFLDTFTQLEDEFMRIELAASGMFDLDHRDTAASLDLEGAVRAIRIKSQLAKDVLRWVSEHKHVLDEANL
ncbi:MAG: hypothetical protein AAF152_03285 [Cyanobacteria bacterium P01_A01_bin.114]